MIYDCPGYHRERDQPLDGEPVEVHGDPIWCEDHRISIRNDLSDMPDLYVGLHIEAVHGTPKPAAGRVSGSKHEPSPSPRLDDADEIVRWACDWEDIFRRELGEPAARAPVSARPRALLEAIHFLTTRLRKALAVIGDPDEPLGLQFGREVHARHRELLRITRRDRLVHSLDPPCPACDMRSLRRHDGDDVIRCTNPECREVWSEVEYQRLVLVLASDIA